MTPPAGGKKKRGVVKAWMWKERGKLYLQHIHVGRMPRASRYANCGGSWYGYVRVEVELRELPAPRAASRRGK